MIHCVLFINMLPCYFILFFSCGGREGDGGEESRKKRYLTKRGVSNQALFEFDDIGWR